MHTEWLCDEKHLFVINSVLKNNDFLLKLSPYGEVLQFLIEHGFRKLPSSILSHLIVIIKVYGRNFLDYIILNLKS